MQLALSGLERNHRYELVYWLEDLGYPAIIIPPYPRCIPGAITMIRRHTRLTLLSLAHAAVEAGLGTLGLNQQL